MAPGAWKKTIHKDFKSKEFKDFQIKNQSQLDELKNIISVFFKPFFLVGVHQIG